MKRAGLVDDVAAVLKSRRPSKRWYQRVSQEHAAMLDELKAAWRDGRLGSARRPAVEAIVAILAARGIANVGRNGVESWLVEQ